MPEHQDSSYSWELPENLSYLRCTMCHPNEYRYLFNEKNMDLWYFLSKTTDPTCILFPTALDPDIHHYYLEMARQPSNTTHDYVEANIPPNFPRKMSKKMYNLFFKKPKNNNDNVFMASNSESTSTVEGNKNNSNDTNDKLSINEKEQENENSLSDEKKEKETSNGDDMKEKNETIKTDYQDKLNDIENESSTSLNKGKGKCL